MMKAGNVKRADERSGWRSEPKHQERKTDRGTDIIPCRAASSRLIHKKNLNSVHL